MEAMEFFMTKIFRKPLFEANLRRQLDFDWIFDQIFVRKWGSIYATNASKM
jgi:hypothetical protein